jgi:hypothetical protein
LFGLQDGYAKLIVGSTSRDYITGYDVMGLTGEPFFNVHFLAHPQARLQFMGDAASPITVLKNTMRDIDIVPPAYATSNSALRSVIRLPMETSFSLQNFRGYTVEARDRSVANDGVLQNGVVVTWVDPFVGAGRDLLVVDDPDHPVNLSEAALEVGDVFEDLARGVRIEVLSTIPWPGGYTVQVANVQPSDMKPDPRITPWNNRWESVDIWIDSPTNGFDTYASPEGNRDRPAVRSQASSPEIVNRFYFRIHNDGFTDAKNVQIKGYYALPGMGQSAWTLVGQTTFGSIAPGGDVTSYFNWVVPDGIPDAHACLKIEIQDDASDLNLANNLAQENVFEFETVQNSPWHARSQQLLVENPDTKRLAHVRVDVENLPDQWAVRIWPESFVLAPGASQQVDFTIYPGGPPAKPSDGYEAGYIAQTPVVAYATYENMEPVVIGGVTARTRLTLPTKLTLDVIDAMTGGAVLGGCLSVDGMPLPNRSIGVQIANAKKADFLYANTDQRGCYQVTLSRLMPGAWQAEAFYEGMDAYGSSRSPLLHYTIK